MLDIDINDVIKLLEKLKEKDAIVKSVNIVPCFENFDFVTGTGIEIIKYNYTIELEYEQETRSYKNNGGFREYIEGE